MKTVVTADTLELVELSDGKYLIAERLADRHVRYLSLSLPTSLSMLGRLARLLEQATAHFRGQLLPPPTPPAAPTAPLDDWPLAPVARWACAVQLAYWTRFGAVGHPTLDPVAVLTTWVRWVQAERSSLEAYEMALATDGVPLETVADAVLEALVHGTSLHAAHETLGVLACS